MRTIWKFPITDETRLVMPVGARPLKLAIQAGVPCLWALVDPTAPLEERHVRVYGTGHFIEDDDFIGDAIYAGSFLDGLFVFHVFLAATS